MNAKNNIERLEYKKKLLESLKEQTLSEITLAKQAALATYDAATNEESKPENEYDTRALEASYLAGAQAKRVLELEAFLALLNYQKPLVFSSDSKIAVSALVEVRLLSGSTVDSEEFFSKKIFNFFILPKGGGICLNFDNKNIQVMTPDSPVGEALLGLSEGDDFFVEIGPRVLEYEVIHFF